MKKKIKLLSVILPILLFILLAVFVSADMITGFESWIYLESTEIMSPVITTIFKLITNIGRVD